MNSNRMRLSAKYIAMALAAVLILSFSSAPAAAWHDVKAGLIVIDAGHGGVDGGTNRDGLLEKNINLNLALKLRALLEEKGYSVILTRDKDVSLDKLNNLSSSRHRRDLIARADIINESSAQLFISIHVNSLEGGGPENGSIVYYGRRYRESRALADYIQKELNAVKLDGESRRQHKPLVNKYYVLGCTDVPGVLVETAFISNYKERQKLQTEGFLNDLAAAMAEGADCFIKSERKQDKRVLFSKALY